MDEGLSDEDMGFSDEEMGIEPSLSAQPSNAPISDEDMGISDADMGPQAEGALGTFGRELAHGAVTTVGALPAMGYGAAMGAELGALTSPVTGPVGPIAGGIIGGLAGGILGGAAVEKASDTVMTLLGVSDSEQRAANREANPNSAMFGSALSAAVAFRPGQLAGSLASRGINAAAMGGVDIGQQLVETGTVDPKEVALSAATGAIFNEARAPAARLMGLGETLAHKTYRAGRPDTVAPTKPVDDAQVNQNDVTITAKGVAAENAPAPEVPQIGNQETQPSVRDGGNKGVYAKGRDYQSAEPKSKVISSLGGIEDITTPEGKTITESDIAAMVDRQSLDNAIPPRPKALEADLPPQSQGQDLGIVEAARQKARREQRIKEAADIPTSTLERAASQAPAVPPKAAAAIATSKSKTPLLDRLSAAYATMPPERRELVDRFAKSYGNDKQAMEQSLNANRGRIIPRIPEENVDLSGIRAEAELPKAAKPTAYEVPKAVEPPKAVEVAEPAPAFELGADERKAAAKGQPQTPKVVQAAVEKLKAAGQDKLAEALPSLPADKREAAAAAYMNKGRELKIPRLRNPTQGLEVADLVNKDGQPIRTKTKAQAQTFTKAIESARATFKDERFHGKDGETPGETRDRARRMLDNAAELNGGKSPIDTYKMTAMDKPREWSILREARKLLKNYITPEEFVQREKLHRGTDEQYESFRSSNKTEADLARNKATGDTVVLKAEEALARNENPFGTPHEEAESMVRPEPVRFGEAEPEIPSVHALRDAGFTDYEVQKAGQDYLDPKKLRQVKEGYAYANGGWKKVTKEDITAAQERLVRAGQERANMLAKIDEAVGAAKKGEYPRLDFMPSDWQSGTRIADNPEAFVDAAKGFVESKMNSDQSYLDRLQRVYNRGQAYEAESVDLQKINLAKPTQKEAEAFNAESAKVENAVKDHFDSVDLEKFSDKLAEEEDTRYNPDKLARQIAQRRLEREQETKSSKGKSLLATADEAKKRELMEKYNKIAAEKRGYKRVPNQAEVPSLKTLLGDEGGAIDLKAFKVQWPSARNALEKYLGMSFTDEGRSFRDHVSQAVTHMNKHLASAAKTLDKAWYQWTRHATQEEAYKYMDVLERTEAVDSDGKLIKAQFKEELEAKGIKPEQADWMADQAEMHRALMNQLFIWDKEHGSKAEYIKNYVSHIFVDKRINGLTAEEYIKQRVDKLGETWYQKERVYDFIADAIKHGYKLQFTNPIDIVHARWAASINSNVLVDTLHSLQRDKLAIPVKEAAEWQKEGPNAWTTKYLTPDHQEWLIHPEGRYIWNNAMVAKGIAARGDIWGSAYRTWMKLKNVWVPLQLAFSAFHELHIIGNIHPAQEITRAIKLSMANGQWGKNFADAGAHLSDGLFALPLDKIGMGLGKTIDKLAGGRFSNFEGRQMQHVWDKPTEQMTPREKMWTQLFEWGGLTPNQTAEEVIGAKRDLAKALGKMEPSLTKAIPAAMRRGIEVSQAAMFKYQIPALKNVSFMRDVAAAFKIDPTLAADPVRARAVVGEIGRNINDRYGEMFYKGSLFWNRYLKDAGIASMLSLSWNLGQVRQAGGAVQNLLTKSGIAEKLGAKPSRLQKTMYNATDKGTFVSTYIGLSMATAGAISYALTGQLPTGLDWTFPRNGETDDRGHPQRLSPPFNTREWAMLRGHIQEHGGGLGGTVAGIGALLWNKMILSPITEAWANRNYYGQELYDRTAPAYKQALQLVDSTLGNRVDPIGLSGARRAVEQGAGAKGAALAVAGFGPAAKYLNNTAMENHINHLFYQYDKPKEYEYGKETGLGKGMIQNQLRGVSGIGALAYSALGKKPDYVESEARQEARTRLSAATKSGDKEAEVQARRDLANPEYGHMGKRTAGTLSAKTEYEYKFSRLPPGIQKSLIRDMSGDEFNRFVLANRAITSRALKAELIKERPVNPQATAEQ